MAKRLAICGFYGYTLRYCKALSNTIALGVEDISPTEKEDAMTTATITKEAAWKLPDLDTVYHCEELGPMTLGQMLDGVDPDLIPSDQTMYEDLLWAFGAWETLEEMNAAMATRVYTATPDGKVGFRLVK